MSNVVANTDYSLVQEWNGGFKSELFFTPIDNIVRDWRIEFEADFDIRGIWGARIVSQEGERYILAPEDENRQYNANQTSKITIVANTSSGDSPLVNQLKFFDSASEVTEVETSTGSNDSNNKNSDNSEIDLDYNLVQEWNGGFKSELFLTPIDNIVQGWRIEFEADFDIRGIWGARVVSQEGERYILAPEDENRQYNANQTSKITIVANTSADDSSVVENLTFHELGLGATDVETPTNTDDHSDSNDENGNNNNDVSNENDIVLDYNLIQEWNGGFKSELFLTPDETVNGWRIEFEADFDIRGIWGARIVSQEGERYILAPEDENRQYSANQSSKITIVADTPDGESSSVDNLTFYDSASDISETETPTDNDGNDGNDSNGGNDNTNFSSGQFRYGEAVQKSLLFYEAQRSGDLPNNNRVEWRSDSALNDGSDVGRDLTGGYYDAGDHVKFGMPMAESMTTVAWGGIEYKTAYKDMGQWNELLDTVKWGTDWILKAHVNPEGKTQEVYVQVGNGFADHAYWGAPEEMTMARPAYKIDANKPGTDISADYAASLASASILFRGENNAYADRLLNEAKQLYEFAENNLGKYSDSVPEVNPFYTSWSGYGDELIWGATWLHKATGEQQYLDKAKQYAQQYGINPGYSTLSWDSKNAGSLVLLAQTGDNYYVNLAENWLDDWLPGGNAVSYTNGGLAWSGKWGSLRTTSNTAFLAGVYHDTVDSDSSYHNFVTEQIDYILGDNPRNSSYVVGFGENPPENPHHRAASGVNNINISQSNENILYGALVGGPKSANDWDWQDDRTDYIGNEVALDYNAGYTGAVAYLYDKYGGNPLTETELDALVGIDVSGV
ncbi:putative endoglucanase [Hyella patelloides LEGE 07179]|uniref:Endoglucanase n=1 Tax=Hyella patelloides LEGE 07179 TaxID=945734 RepID=A0A563VMU6_9CYAN|nr:glycoside hydrolase family 9 protein [Hyella patelloides]VEP12732.1 putative endoglucanase [Hyella patelloides LEGE 07179]